MTQTSQEQQNTLSLPMATILGLNAVIGAGIFAVPTGLQQFAGPLGLFAFLIVIATILILALAMGRMAKLYPSGGIFYNHTVLWAPKIIAFIASASYIIGLMVALSLLTRIAAGYVATELFYWAHLPYSHGHTQLICVGIIGLTTIACFGNTRTTKLWQVALITFTLIPLLVITLLCITKAHLAALTPFAPLGWAALPKAINLVIFGFFGFEAIPALFSSIKNPEKNVPRAIIATVIITGLIYFIFTASVMLSFPASLAQEIQFESSNHTFSLIELLRRLFPTLKLSYWPLSLINWSLIIVIIGTIHSMLLAITALVSEPLIKKHETLHFSQKKWLLIGISSIIATLTMLFHDINRAFSITALLIVFAYGCTIMPLILLPRGRTVWQVILATCALIATLLIFLSGINGLL